MVHYITTTEFDFELLDLLNEAGLGKSTMKEVDLWRLAYEDQVLVGCGGLIIKGDYAYLRSLAVSIVWRNRGIGAQINADLLLIATLKNVKEAYIMTSEKAYFEGKGYILTCKTEAPQEVLAIGQLGDVCCSGCDMMVQSLTSALEIVELHRDHYEAIRLIYQKGIETGVATFETSTPPDFCYFIDGKEEKSLIGHVYKGRVLSWAVISKTSKRKAYAGVGEVSVYVDPDYRGLGLGSALLEGLIEKAKALGYWTIQSDIITLNHGSRKLHEALGFRCIGVREAISQMQLGPFKNQWMDVVLYELKLTDR